MDKGNNYLPKGYPGHSLTPCDEDGNDILPGTPPPPCPTLVDKDGEPMPFFPYKDCEEFRLAHFLFKRNQMPGTEIDKIMQIWANTLPDDCDPPFANHADLYATIDATTLGNAPWQSFSVTYMGTLPEHGEILPWMLTAYDNQLRNPSFKNQFDYTPYQKFNDNGEHEWGDFMSANWAYQQADIIATKDPQTHGALFVPVILGSDKTTVLVATGQNEFYPLYISNGNVHNNVHRAHGDGLLLRSQADQKYRDDDKFRMFHRRLFHSSLVTILLPLRPAMRIPEVTLCPDGYLRHVIYGLGPYIADYPEQALLACIVQGWCPKCTAPADDLDAPAGRCSLLFTETLFERYSLKTLWNEFGAIGNFPFTAEFPRADIHELLCSDLLHQIIKGMFKDHLITWVGEYLIIVHGPTCAAAIMADIDHRIAASLPFPGQRCFPEGRGFKQWTGDDSKALMKVYLPAISGHVPCQMVHCLAALRSMGLALNQFHAKRVIFTEHSVRVNFNLPRQHSLIHYRRNIQLFGSPNGLCSSITESKHIRSVKELWRRSSHFKALGQMLLTNQCLDKLSASQVDFMSRDLLPNAMPINPNIECQIFGDLDAIQVPGPRVMNVVTLALTRESGYPLELEALAAQINLPLEVDLIRHFLFDQLYPNSPVSGNDVNLAICPVSDSNIHVFHSALATFYAPSNPSGIGGMHHQHIWATPSWQQSYKKDPALAGFRGLHAAQICLFFSFKHDHKTYPCALVQWFSPIGDELCEDMGTSAKCKSA
ncbi:hypothetical protein BJV77DRAFT_1060934 [Russula vinacea]|nr:hypothetical protein BJV77DRAFT_1060934 [Russula vinacea]